MTDVTPERLLARMTLDQKVGQMTQPERMHITPDEVRQYHIGSVLSGGGSFPGDNRPADWVAMNDAFWEASMSEEDGGIAIPLLYGVDAIHGNNNVVGATIFPHNIGLGAARDPELIERIAAVTAKEILATGVDWTFAPTLAVVRNVRWGRTYESYGEDAAVVASYAGRFVTGLQAGYGPDGVLGCAKHWVGDGGTTDGIDQGDTDVSEETLDAVHVNPYRPAIKAGVGAVMASFNSWNGDKCHGSHYLLTTKLREHLGFEGLIVSDWNGTDQLAADFVESIALGANAGIDLFMMPEKWKELIEALKQLVRDGIVPEDRIDDAVLRILRVKFAMGLFHAPRPADRPWSNSETFGSAEHRAVAREAVRKSLVLMKNEGAALPLARQANIIVAGKNAHDRGHQCGGFTVAWQGQSGNEVIEGGTSIWEGIHAVAPHAVLSPDGSACDDGNFDVAVVVIGERPYAEGMGDIRGVETVVEPGSGPGIVPGAPTERLEPYAESLEHAVNHPEDLATIRRIAEKGIPIVTVLVSGRPLVVNPEMSASDAFVAAWLPGSEGAGVADVLFGDHAFRGRLSFSWPASADQNPSREDAMYVPAFPVGYGLGIG